MRNHGEVLHFQTGLELVVEHIPGHSIHLRIKKQSQVPMNTQAINLIFLMECKPIQNQNKATSQSPLLPNQLYFHLVLLWVQSQYVHPHPTFHLLQAQGKPFYCLPVIRW